VDGVALLAATIKELMTKTSRTILSTHYLEIFQFDLLPELISKGLVYHMDVHIPAPAPKPPTLTGEWPTSPGVMATLLSPQADCIALLLLSNTQESSQYHPSMSVLLTGLSLEDDANDDVPVVPLFKIQRGVATSSEGFSCAILAGVPNAVIGRAK